MPPHISSPVTASPPAEPRAEQRPLERTLHDVRLVDEYAWLKAENWREVMRDPFQLDPAIRAYLQAENDYCERALADTKSLQDTLFAEMKGRIKEDDFSVPKPDGPYAYYARYRQGGQHPLLCRQPRDSADVPSAQTADLARDPEKWGPVFGKDHAQTGSLESQEQLLLDGDALARGKAFFRLGDTEHSSDHRLLAWLADDAGSELYTARVRDIDTGADLADVVPDVSGAVVWTQDASAFYYVRLDESHRPAGVFRQSLGTPVAADVCVFTEADPGFFVSVDRHLSGRFGDISAHDHETSEAWLDRSCRTGGRADARCRAPNRRPVPGRAPSRLQRRPGLDHPHQCRRRRGFQDRLDAARHARSGLLARSRSASAGRLHPDVPGARGLARYGSSARTACRASSSARLASGEEHVIAFAEEAYSLGIDGGYEFATNLLRFTYSSMTTPAEIWDYDLVSRQRVLRKRQEIPSGHNSADYVTRRLFAPAADGETIPISLLYRKDVAARRHRALPALRLRRLRHVDPRLVQQQPVVAGRPRLRLCHRACARRQREGLALVSRRQARQEDEHVHRFHRGERISRQERLVRAGDDRRRGPFRRRELDRRGRQYAAGPLRRADRRSAVCRRAQHHARRDAAAHAAGMAGMGRSDPRRGGISRPSWPTRPTRTCARRIIRRSSRWRA